MKDSLLRTLTPQSLTKAAFADFGDVIEVGDDQIAINYGQTSSAADLTKVDVTRKDGYPRVSLFTTQPLPRPITIKVMERHPLGSQMFYPLNAQPYLVVVALGGVFDPATVQAFIASGQQGVSYRAGVWHHFSLALLPNSRFLVLDRGGPGNNTEEIELSAKHQVLVDYEMAGVDT